MRLIYLLAVYLHIISAAALVGGSIIMLAYVMRMASFAEMRDVAPRVAPWLAGRFKKIRWHSMWLAALTGFFAASYRGVGFDALASGEAFKTGFGHTFVFKVLVFLVAVAITVIVDIGIAPKLGRLAAGSGDPTETTALRAKMMKLIRVNAGLGFLLVFLGVLLVRGV